MKHHAYIVTGGVRGLVMGSKRNNIGYLSKSAKRGTGHEYHDASAAIFDVIFGSHGFWFIEFGHGSGSYAAFL